MLNLSKKNQLILKKNLEDIEFKIQEAIRKSHRQRSEINLLPITKHKDIEVIKALYDLGFSSFGESKVLELLEKEKSMKDLSLNWHLVGHLQTNKISKLKDLDVTIHSVDRIRVLEKLSGLDRVLKVFLQVNISGEESKQGFTSEEVAKALQKALDLKNIQVQGLMTMAPKPGLGMEPRECFAKLRELKLQLENSFGLDLKELSMGMSNDFEDAILEGSTCIRVGSALFKDLV